MKKIVLYSCISLLLGACSKKDDSPGSSANTWNFAGTNYSAATVVYINAGAQSNLSASATGATATNANGLVFTFMTPPTSSGQMLITNTIDPNTVLVTASRLSGTTATFYSNDATNTSASVTVNNGKVGISFAGSIWLHNDADHNDSAQLSISTITQQ
jgi:hypothetical protein